MKLQDQSTEPRHTMTLTDADHARELAEREERLKLIYNSTHDCMFLMRVEGGGQFRCESVNRAYTEVTGLREDQVVGHRPQDILPPAAAAFALGRYMAAIDSRSPLVYAEDIMLPAGRVVFETILTPIIDAKGDCTHLLGALRDITARKIAEELGVKRIVVSITHTEAQALAQVIFES